MAVALNPAALGIPAAAGGALTALAAGWWCRRWFTSAGERPNEHPGDMTT